jgi:hypothetical protein
MQIRIHEGKNDSQKSKEFSSVSDPYSFDTNPDLAFLYEHFFFTFVPSITNEYFFDVTQVEYRYFASVLMDINMLIFFFRISWTPTFCWTVPSSNTSANTSRPTPSR